MKKFREIKLGQLSPPHITPEVEYFLVFRFFGKAPMIGHKQGETFYVLWFDPNYEVYPH